MQDFCHKKYMSESNVQGYTYSVAVNRIWHIEIAQAPHVVYAEELEDIVKSGRDFHVGASAHAGHVHVGR